MRWKGILLLVCFVAIAVLLTVVFSDSWIEARLEKLGGSLVGARVEIDGFEVSLSDLSFSWQRLQVTDPANTMKNSVETGRAAFKMNAPALFRKRYVIEELTLSEVRAGTPREYDGAIPQKVKRRKRKESPGLFDTIGAKLEAEIDKLPVMSFDVDAITRNLNLDSLIVLADLKMVDRVDSAKTDILATAEKWREFYDDFDPEQELQEIRADIESINPADITNVLTIARTLEKAKSIRDRVNALQATITTKHKEIHEDFNRVSNYGSNVDDWFNEDFRSVMAKAKLPDLSVKNIGKILFGGTLVNQVNRFLGYARTVREYMPEKRDKPEKEKRPRFAGQNIIFPDRHAWPEFLIKKIHLSGSGATASGSVLQLSGEAPGNTSQPWIYGEPTLIGLQAMQEGKLSGKFDATLDHTTEKAKDDFSVQLQNKTLAGLKIHRTPYLPDEVNGGLADISYTISFEEGNFSSRIAVAARDLQFDYGGLASSDRFVQITREVINSIDVLELSARVSARGEEVSFTVDSNLDELVSRKLQSMGSQALTDARNKISSRLNAVRAEKMAEADALYREKKAEIEGVIDDYKKRIDEEKAKIEAKLKLFPG